MPTNDQGGDIPTVNPDLKAVQKELIAYARELDVAVGRAKSSAEVNAILDEINEVTARIVSVGRQLFTRQTEAISAASAEVLSQAGEAKKAVQEIEDVKTFIKEVGSFLAVVDRVVDMAKLVI